MEPPILFLDNIHLTFGGAPLLEGADLQILPRDRISLVGRNGSGKSTLLKVISGHTTPTKGRIGHYTADHKKLPNDAVYPYISYAAPYIELIEELTLIEAITFHRQLKPFYGHLSAQDVLQLSGLSHAANKEIRHFSSGMKQRVKTTLAVCSDTACLLLDEPATNLDLQAIAWYKQLVEQFSENRLVLIASNDLDDIAFCQEHINILDYKE